MKKEKKMTEYTELTEQNAGETKELILSHVGLEHIYFIDIKTKKEYFIERTDKREYYLNSAGEIVDNARANANRIISERGIACN